MKEVVSISLGSSKRNHIVEAELLGEKFRLSRIGTDGDFSKAIEMLKEYDGHAAAIGLGGIDLYLFAGEKRYVIRDAKKLRRAVKRTPVADGSGLKNTLEREVIKYLAENGYPLKGKKVLMVSAVDRFGMAEALEEAGCDITFGDLIFGLNINFPIRTFRSFLFLARALLPVVTKMPFKILYPTGKEQEKEPDKKYTGYYEEAEIIAGDFLFVRKYMPKNMKGKWVITNTVTSADIDDLREREVSMLVTTTPEFEGRSFGTNVMEAMFLAILGKQQEDTTPEDYLALLKKLDFKPRIIEFDHA